MRTTIDIPGPLGEQARDVAGREGTTLRALILEGLELVLSRREADDSPFRLPDCSFGEGGLVDGLEDGDWQSIRDRLYAGRGA